MYGYPEQFIPAPEIGGGLGRRRPAPAPATLGSTAARDPGR